MRREEVAFGAPGERRAAWLYRPDEPEPIPCVVMAHGLAYPKEFGLDAFASRFARVGLTVLVFDYRHFGESDGSPRHVLDLEKQREDWDAALSYVRALPGIDPERVAVWGTSFSGGHAIETAARDGRVAAAVAQVPLADGRATARTSSPGRSLRLFAAALRDLARRRLLGKSPHYVKAVGPQGSLAMVASEEVAEGHAKIAPPGTSWRNELGAAAVLQIGRWNPGKLAGRISRPLLICVSERDEIVPIGPAIAAAERAPKGELRSYPGGHYAAYTGEVFEHLVRDQIEFFTRHLLPASP